MLNTYAKILSLLTQRERRRFALILGVVLATSILEMAGIASILPFLSVLSNRELIEENAMLNLVYEGLGFTSSQSFLVFLGFGVFVLVVTGLLLKGATIYALTRFGVMRSFNISARLLKGYLHQPYAWFLSRHSSSLGTGVLMEVDKLVSGCLLPALTLIPYLTTTIMIAGFILIVEPTIGFSAIVLLGGGYGGIYIGLRGLLQRTGRVRVAANKERFHTVQEATGGLKEMKLMALERTFSRQFDHAAFRMARVQSIEMVLRQTPRFALEAIAFGGMIVMILYLLIRGGGRLDVLLPTLGFIAMASTRLFPALQQIFTRASTLRFNEATLDNIYSELEALTLPDSRALDAAEAIPPLRLKENLVLERLGYSYPSAEHAALEDVSLTIRANTTVGLVGGTGAGKTTLVDIILGLLSPEHGTLKVDGAVVTPQLNRAWQKTLGYVPQHIFLSDDTVAANIAFGVPPENIDMEAVERTARIANLHAFVEAEMPQGYATPVGERGVRLSGGQRQRVGIARALYHDPDVLILDEATSALDNVTERAVMEAVHNIGGQKTILMIAHRLSTVQNCDRIFLLKQGRVVASGGFDELVGKSADFRNMVEVS